MRINMDAIDRLMDVVGSAVSRIEPDWMMSAQKTEHAGAIIDICKDLLCMEEMLGQREAVGSYGGSYRRGRDSMGRYTSYGSGYDEAMGRIYSRANDMRMEPGYSGAERQKVEELCREIEFMQSRVSKQDRDVLQKIISELQG